MSLIASAKGSSIPAPAGVHRAACVAIYDLGTQVQKNPDHSPRREVLLVWELVDEMMPDGRPFVVNRRFGLSLSRKATLRGVLEAWRGRAFTDEELEGFDLAKVLGAPGQVNIVHNKEGDNVYANITSVMPLGKGQNPIRETYNETRFFSMDVESPIIPHDTPNWIVERIKSSPEWKHIEAASKAASAPVDTAVADGTADDDIPF